MTFSLSDRLYSMMTGLLFSSMPSESMRPPWTLPGRVLGGQEAHAEERLEVALHEGLERPLDDDRLPLEAGHARHRRHGRA